MKRGKAGDWLTEEGLSQVEGWARCGLTEKQIAHNMGICDRTLTEWKRNYTAISSALKKGKEVADFQVENALFRRAIGYRIEEQKIEILPDGKKKAIQTIREVPGDVTAMIFWLKNRKPDKWNDRRMTQIKMEPIPEEAIEEVENYLNGLDERV